jgi:hypothetical protein
MFETRMGLTCGTCLLPKWHWSAASMRGVETRRSSMQWPLALWDRMCVKRSCCRTFPTSLPSCSCRRVLGGGGYVIYKIGCADGAITGSNGTGLVGPCTCCHNGTTDADCNCPAPDQTHERTCQDVLHSRTLYRPWERVNSGMPNWDWRDLNLGFESMAPVVLGNGTILSLTRSWGTPAPYPNSAFWLVRGSAWSGTYAKVNPAVAAQPFLPVTMGWRIRSCTCTKTKLAIYTPYFTSGTPLQ